jgi:hypothetical protein
VLSLFDGTGTQQGAAWLDTGTTGAGLNELATGLDPGAYHWRARLRYDATTTPLQAAGRWLTLSWNGWQETDLTLAAFVGGVVWEDQDGDGVRGGSEAPLSGIDVDLLDGLGGLAGSVLTDDSGAYRYELPGPGPFRLRFVPPVNHVLTSPDQGSDDLLDSDADPITGETPLIGLRFTLQDTMAWGAGLRLCIPPDQPVLIAGARIDQGSGFLILDISDPNPAIQVTGYNVYRSSEPSVIPSLWPRLALDAVDMDGTTPDVQWLDVSGVDPPPGGILFYHVTPYNNVCAAEGPF